jgi:hypothetical protein
MIERGYLRAFGLSVVVLLALFLALTWVVDPYGVSPLRLSWPGVNVVKPKRLAIDRLIKPYDVWRDQPRSVFLGTSRLHEGIDPAALDGTRFAPAYNAAMPGATLADMAAQLEQFFRMDGNLRAVFVELFLANFASEQPVPPRRSLPSLVQGMTHDLAPLFLGASAIPDSLQTLFVNLSGRPAAYVAPAGQWVPAAHARFTFHQEAAIAYYINEHATTLKGMALAPQAFAALDRIAALCREHGAELHLWIAPSHPWDEYRFRSFGQWPLMEEWLRRLGTYPNVISFAQYNAVAAEPVTDDMRYWNDTLHFNTRLGQLMVRAFLGATDPDIPANLLRQVTPATVESVLQEHRAGISRWIGENPAYPAAFDHARTLFEVRRRGAAH